MTGRPRRGVRLAALFGTALAVACGADQGPFAERPIDGTWELIGLYALDVRGLIQCRLSGTLDLQQLPGGVNTIVGNGRLDFDCTVDGESDTWEGESALMNSRLEGPNLSMTLAGCQLLGSYDRSQPDVISDGRSFCRMSFPPTGLVDVAGTWEGHREIVP